MLETKRIAEVNPTVVATPTELVTSTINLSPTEYDDPPSIILTPVIEPNAFKLKTAVEFWPVVKVLEKLTRGASYMI